MKILGRDYELALTVGASTEIADLCPDGDINRVKEIFERGSAKDVTEFFLGFICALSRGAEARRAVLEPGYEPRPVTEELLRLMTVDELAAAKAEALSVWKRDKQPTVEAAPAKKNEGSAGPGSGSI